MPIACILHSTAWPRRGRTLLINWPSLVWSDSFRCRNSNVEWSHLEARIISTFLPAHTHSHTCAQTHTLTHTYAHKHTHSHSDTQKYTNKILYTCTHFHKHAYSYIYSHILAHTHTCTLAHTLHTSSSSSFPLGEVRDVSDWILCSPPELTESKVRSSWEELPFLKMVVEGVAWGLYFPLDFFFKAFMSFRNGVGKRTS